VSGRSDYEERRQARIDRYKERSENASEKSDAHHAEFEKRMSAIPMGQPILIGHHSEQRDRNYREKAGRQLEKSYEESQKADYYAEKAAAAESNTAIYSDDPEAVSKLKAKLEQLSALQDTMKEANKYYRKHKTMVGFGDLPDDEAREWDDRIRGSYSWEQRPYPAYELSNNNANIARIKSRIAQLDYIAEREPAEPIPFSGGRIVENAEINRVQIFFDEKPDEETRSKLKQYGFRWARSEGAWQRLRTENALKAAKYVMGAKES